MGRGKSSSMWYAVLDLIKKHPLIELNVACCSLPFDRSSLSRVFDIFVETGWLIKHKDGVRVFYVRNYQSPTLFFEQLDKEEHYREMGYEDLIYYDNKISKEGGT